MTTDKQKTKRGVSRASAKSSALKQLELRVAELEKQTAEHLEGWQRAKADYENLRRRTEDQRSTVVKAASEEMVRSLLPIVDNMERALKAASESNSDELRDGVEMVFKQLVDTLAAQGVEQIEAVGKEFDPEIHEAIARIKGKENICVSEHARGYKLYGKVVRPARVSVGTQAPIKKNINL